MLSSDDTPRWIPITKLARQWGRSVDHIKAHVKAGRLTAMDTRVGEKEQLVVLLADVEAFEFTRSTKPIEHQRRRPMLRPPKDHYE